MRKWKELFFALKIEVLFSKEEILEMYLNKIYLGASTYGIQSASQRFFAKSVEEINPAEAALLASLPKAPSYLNPLRHLDRAQKRQHRILKQMQKDGFLTNQELENG